MPLYAAVLYTQDVDWTAPEQAAEMAEYGAFGPGRRRRLTWMPPDDQSGRDATTWRTTTNSAA
jgi:hypothetical protein